MKTTIRTIILASVALFAAMSCQKETAGTQDLVKEGETIQVNINAGLGDFVAADATKATATPVVRLEWEENDKVDAYYGNAKISGDARISVTPSDNKIFAKLSGTITAPSGHTFVDNDIITFVYSNLDPSKVSGLTFDFSSQDATIPFVAYATVKWSEIKSGLTDKMVEFKFATSVMKIAATNLGGGNITNAKIDGINTKVTLTPQTSSETVTIGGNTSGTITKTAGIDPSTDKTRAIFTVGLVPDSNTGRSITITITQTDYTNKGVITSTEILSSKSYTTPASLFTCGSLNGHDYVSIAGTKWATQNLAITDSGKKAWKGGNTGDNPEVKVPGTNEDVIVGDYFQWAAYAGYNGGTSAANNGLLLYTSFTNTKCFGVTGTDGFNSESKAFNITNAPYGGTSYTHYTSTDGTTNLGKTDDVASILWGDNWRMPTSAEFKTMRAATYWAWDATDCGYYVFMPGLGTSGVAGGRADITSSDDKSKALLFFPTAGYGNITSLNNAGSRGNYWSGTLDSSNTSRAYLLTFTISIVDSQSYNTRAFGNCVRPVSD